MTAPRFECKLLNDKAKPPVRATSDAAGYDLYGVSRQWTGYKVSVVNTGIAVQIPHGYCGIIKARSSYAFKYGMNILAGVIDADYRDEVKVLFTTDIPFEFEPGERFAQMLIMPILTSPVHIVENFSRDETNRTGGFGSTGNTDLAASVG